MYDWESLFISEVLNRGRNLYINGKVVDFKKTEKGYSGAVLTRERTDVSARKLPSGVWRMSCKCPASRAGRTCEHMAALMHAVEASEEAEKDKENQRMREADLFEKKKMRDGRNV